MAVSFAFQRTERPAAKRPLKRISDGDTPVVEQPIRLVSCDTPEKAGYAGRPALAQPKLDTCAQRLSDGFYPQVPVKLRKYLVGRLTADAAERHIGAAERASQEFQRLLDRRLIRPDGSQSGTAVIPSGEFIDRYGRLLAYVAPWLKDEPGGLPPPGDPRRNTFNLDMIANGWAAFFPVYPSLPKNPDLAQALAAADAAWTGSLGAWSEFGTDLLLAYEYRLCIRLGTAKDAKSGMQAAFQRQCVDLRSLADVGKYGWADVPPSQRLWYWHDDRAAARRDLAVTS